MDKVASVIAMTPANGDIKYLIVGITFFVVSFFMAANGEDKVGDMQPGVLIVLICMITISSSFITTFMGSL